MYTIHIIIKIKLLFLNTFKTCNIVIITLSYIHYYIILNIILEHLVGHISSSIHLLKISYENLLKV